MKSLDNKVVVITGAGSGIGRALALECAGRGALLALSDINLDSVTETETMALSAGAREVRIDPLDVADRAEFAAYAEEVAAHFGRVNVIINNAGVALAGDVLDLEYDDIEWITGINYWGVVHGTKEFLPHLIASGDGHVVNVSSLFGLLGIPGQAAYNATKFAVRGFSEALRIEMLQHGYPVGVSVVHPGGIKTSIARSARYSSVEDGAATANLFDNTLARMTPERAAEIIIAGVLSDQARILVGLDAHALFGLSKLLGSRYQEMISVVARMSMPPKVTAPKSPEVPAQKSSAKAPTKTKV